MNKYIAVINKKDGYEVAFPDFPGCVTTGVDLDEAKARAREALELHISGMVKDNDEIPEESNLDLIPEMLAECDGAPHLEWIAVKIPPSKAVRVDITLPENLLRQVDKKLAGRKNRRSAFIARALEHELAAH